MVFVETVVLIVAMGVVGVPLLLNLVTPAVGAVVTRTLPPTAWDDVMLLFAQGSAAAITFVIGMFVLALPWYACLIAALMVGVTSYAKRMD